MELSGLETSLTTSGGVLDSSVRGRRWVLTEGHEAHTMGGGLFNSTDLQAGAEASGASWRVWADVRELSCDPLHALRVLLVADVLRRYVEDVQQGRALLAVLEHEAGSASRSVSVKAIWIDDPNLITDSPTVAATALGGPPSVVLRPEQAVQAGPAGRILRIAGVRAVERGGDVPSMGDVLGTHEPLAFRLALLRFRHEWPAVLSTARLHRAEETLQRWRFKVASWAEMPPAPPPPHSLEALQEALDDLDTRTVLTLMHRMEVDPRLASGSKFKAFTYADRVLTLDLCHLVGKLRR